MSIFFSTRCSIKQTNQGKLDRLDQFVSQYRKVANYAISRLWVEDCVSLPSFAPAWLCKQLQDKTWLTFRATQRCIQQAIGILNSVKRKQSKRLYQYNLFIKDKKQRKANKIKSIIDRNNKTIPNADKLQPMLDVRSLDISVKSNTKYFDAWIIIKCYDSRVRGAKIVIPFKKHKHFNKLIKNGTLSKSVKIQNKNIQFCFEVQSPKEKQSGIRLGIDIGQRSVISTSQGFQPRQNIHKHQVNQLTDLLCKKKRGSYSYKKVRSHITNITNAAINQINLSNVQTLIRQNLKQFQGYSKKTSKFASGQIADKLDRYALQHGVRVVRISPTYTSQRCSCCGWVQKANRQGDSFCCQKCHFNGNSDINAAINISLKLQPISASTRKLQLNRKGFFWLVEVLEEKHPCGCAIVPLDPKISNYKQHLV